jgi:uncharacterized membrane protein YsdA (DUF1294 family)/cold shock CspA family protein
MRFAGRITEWNDEKGFGFVVPNGGGTRAFVHISQFQGRPRRPVVGDLISYLPVVDDRGRTKAQQIRPAGAKVKAVRPRSRAPRAALGGCVLVLALLAYAGGALPVLLPGIYWGASVLSYLLYGWDKAAAQNGRRRVPESNLHITDLLGGWPGALVAQQQFRHKTMKQSFQFMFWATVVVNLVACVWFVRSGLAGELSQSFVA